VICPDLRDHAPYAKRAMAGDCPAAELLAFRAAAG
jgi:hypothetical protein